MAKRGKRVKRYTAKHPVKHSARNSCSSIKPGWKREKCEHPWATDKQVKRIDADHKRLGKG